MSGTFGSVEIEGDVAVKTIDTEDVNATLFLLGYLLDECICEDELLVLKSDNPAKVRNMWVDAIQREVRLQNIAAAAGISVRVTEAVWRWRDGTCDINEVPPEDCCELRAILKMGALQSTFEEYSLFQNLQIGESVVGKRGKKRIYGKLDSIDGHGKGHVDGIACDAVHRQYAYVTMSDVEQIIDILDTLQNIGIQHNDWKPDNVMCKDGKWYVIDFGFSKETATPQNFKTASRPTKIQKFAPEVPDEELDADERNEAHKHFTEKVTERAEQEAEQKADFEYQMQPASDIFDFKLRL